MVTELTVRLRDPETHVPQKTFVDSTVKRVVVKAGRRGGKTVGAAIKAVKAFLAGRRVLYAAPTSEQTDKFWFEVKRALAEPIDAGVLKQNDSEQFIERPGTENRIKAKTAWNANTLRGDYADLLILDEFQLMAEDAWDEVGAPMLLDNNGDVVFIFTPPSLRSSGVSKAKDPRHASKLFKDKLHDPAWQCIHFTSMDNPFISTVALAGITADMSLDAYRREILAEDDEIETSWLVHSKFNEALCKIKRFEIPSNWDVMSGHDFGTANPAALFLARVKLPLPVGAPAYMRFNDLVAFREYAPGAGYSTAQHVEAFKRIIRLPGQDDKAYNIIKRVGGNHSTEAASRNEMTLHGWPVTEPTINAVNAQIDRVIGLEELNKFYVFDDLYGLLGQMANCMWELDADNKPTKNKVKDEAKYHLLAALRYIGSEFTPETVVSGHIHAAVSYH